MHFGSRGYIGHKKNISTTKKGHQTNLPTCRKKNHLFGFHIQKKGRGFEKEDISTSPVLNYVLIQSTAPPTMVWYTGQRVSIRLSELLPILNKDITSHRHHLNKNLCFNFLSWTRNTKKRHIFKILQSHDRCPTWIHLQQHLLHTSWECNPLGSISIYVSWMQW